MALLALLLGGAATDLAMRLDVVYLPRDPPRFRAMGERVRQEPGPRLVIADPNALHTILLYYLFPDPLAMYRTCFIAADGGGTQCHRGDDHLITLTILPYMTAGWDERSRERFAKARASGPSWVVYSGHFDNHLLLADLRASCASQGDYGDYGALSLYRCPAVPAPP